MAHDVFLSYSSKDKTVADAACAMLEAKGVRCWMAPRDIMPGSEWGAAIIEAIGAARIMVLIYTASSNASPQVRREVERAVARGLHVIPFRVEDVPMSPALEYFISSPHWLDAISPPLERHLDHLARIVKAVMEAQRTGGAAGVDPLDPGPSGGGGASPSMQSAAGAAGWTHGPPPGSFAHGAPPAGTATVGSAAASVPKPHGAGEVPRFTEKRSATPMLVGAGVLVLVLLAVVIVFAATRGGDDEKAEHVASGQTTVDNVNGSAARPGDGGARPASVPADPVQEVVKPPVKPADDAGKAPPPPPPVKRERTAEDLKEFWALLSESIPRLRTIERKIDDDAELLGLKNEAGNTPVYEAAKAGRAAVVSMLLRRGADARAVGEGGNTPLHAAAASGITDEEVINSLAAGNLDVKNAEGDAPVHIALEEGHAATARLLIAAEADPNVANGKDNTPLQLALSLDDAMQLQETAAALLRAGATCDVVDARNSTPLHTAARLGDASLIGLMLRNKAKPDARDADGRTPLHLAVLTRKVDAVTALAGTRKAVEQPDAQGNTPLHLAAAAGDTATAEALLRAGAKVATATPSKRTALHAAAAAGHEAMVRLLMPNGGADVLTNGKRPTPVEVAEKAGKAEVAKLLRQLEFPAMLQAAIRSPNQPVPARLLETIRKNPALVGKGSNGRNALHEAAAAGNAALAAELAKINPALLKELTPTEETPLHLAAAGKHAAAAKALLAAGASVRATTDAGDTPLHVAAKVGAAEVVQILIDVGADPSSTNRDGRTPADVAAAAVKGVLDTAEDQAAEVRRSWVPLELVGKRFEVKAPGLDQPLRINFVDRTSCTLEGYVRGEFRRFDARYAKGPLTLTITAPSGESMFPGIPGEVYAGKVTMADGGEKFSIKVGDARIEFE